MNKSIRIRKRWLCLALSAVLVMSVAACKKGDGNLGSNESVTDNLNDENENNGTGNDVDEISDEEIRFKTIPLESNGKGEADSANESNEKQSWWIRRNEDHKPSECDDITDLSDYNACYTGCDSSEKTIYFTFDCGYENGYTEKMLDILIKENVPACFFVTQTYIRDNVEIVKKMKENGFQVGNHTITHPCLVNQSYNEIVNELNGCYDYMKCATGYEMDPYFRPPCGEYSERVLAIARDLGYMTVFWSIAYMDYDVNKQPGCEYVTEHFRKYHHDGAIVLMHNVSSSNYEALETVIKELKEAGYKFGCLNSLFSK